MSDKESAIVKIKKELIKKDIAKMFENKIPEWWELAEYAMQYEEFHKGIYENIETGKEINMDEVDYKSKWAQFAKSEFAKRMKKIKIKKEKKIEEEEREMQRKRNEEPTWIACKMNAIGEVVEEISINSASYLMLMLAKATIRKDGTLVNKRGKPYLAGEIASEVFEISRQKASRVLKELEHFQILIPIKTGVRNSKIYKINKEFHSIGQKIEEVFVKLYKHKLMDLIEKYDMKSALGVLYKLLPFIHYQLLFICWNPDHDLRKDTTKSIIENVENETLKRILHISQRDLAEILKLDVDTIGGYFKKFEEIGIMKNWGFDKEPKYLFHPDFVLREDWGSPNGYASTIRFLFNQKNVVTSPRPKRRKSKKTYK